MLSAQYSLSVASLALKLKISEAEAQHLLRQHRDLFRQYWRWSDDYVQHALQVGEVRTVFDWRHLIGRGRPDSPINERSIANWPIQATGSEILRIACIMAKRRGLRILAPIHDAVLIEAPIDRIEADTALMREIMRRASRVVLNATADGTHELRTDAKIVRYPDRYGDSRGDKIWAHVVELLEKHKRERSDRREESAQGSVCESATVVDRASV
jgi:DNA polymerase-1